MAGGGMLSSGISGLLSAQRALATTSQNISNVNTEGYSRQRVELTARSPDAAGYGFVGTGVQIGSIERTFDAFVTSQLRSSTASSAQFSEFYTLASRVNNLLADVDSGLMPSMQSFFDAVQTVADDPASIPARQVLLSEGETLAARFQYLDQGLADIRESINQTIRAEVTAINGLSTALAGVNRDISSALSAGNGNSPNDLLDRRDQLLLELSERVSVTTVEQDNGALNVFIGSGQAVVVGLESRELLTMNNSFDPEQIEVGFSAGANAIELSNQLTGGSLGGLLNFRTQLLDSAQDGLGQIAMGLVETFNDQHRLGVDLNGVLGGDFFDPLNNGTPQILANSSSVASASQINVTVSDAGQLTGSNYRLERSGTNYTMTRLDDNATVTLATFPGAAETVDGITLSLNSGNIADGDSFLIRPVRNAARDINLAVTTPQSIAMAVPVRTSAALTNTGTGTIDPGSVTDAGTYISDTYSVVMADSTTGDADGVAIGAITDDATTANALQYNLSINGTVVYTQNEGDPLLADQDALAATINLSSATTGVRAYVNTTTNALFLARDPASSLPVTVTESLIDSGATPLDAADAATGYFGSALSGAAPTNSITYGGAADSYVVIDSAGNMEASGAYTTGGAITFNGIATSVSGEVNSGDTFVIENNSSGVSDNRNALQLASLQTSLILDSGTASYEDVFGRLIADVASQTRQAEVNSTAQQSILQQNLEERASISGVNLDEEAANMMQFQQAYQAAAQVISAADSMFQTLINSIGR